MIIISYSLYLLAFLTNEYFYFITCIKGLYAIFREKNGKLISEVAELKNRYNQRKDKSSHFLYVKQADEKDSGTYTCKTVLNGVSLSSKIEAFGKVRIRTPSNVNVVEGEKLSIICDVIGTPAPTIHWIAS